MNISCCFTLECWTKISFSFDTKAATRLAAVYTAVLGFLSLPIFQIIFSLLLSPEGNFDILTKHQPISSTCQTSNQTELVLDWNVGFLLCRLATLTSNLCNIDYRTLHNVNCHKTILCICIILHPSLNNC